MSNHAVEAALRDHSAGHLSEAEAMYRKILAENPNHPDALHLLGVVRFQQGDKRAAIDYISRAIALNPQVPDFHSNLALAHLDNGEADKALIECQRALALQPNHADALHQLGNALKHLGRLKESIEPYQRAIALRPDFAIAMGNLAESLGKLGRTAEAEALNQRVLTLSPDSITALTARGEALLRQQKSTEAASVFRMVVEKWPNEWIGHNSLGVALYGEGRINEAIALYERAAALAPDHPEPWNNLGFARVGQGRIEEGIRCYEKALSIRPDFVDAHNGLGNAYLAKLDLDAAMRCYENAIYFQADHPGAHWNRALLYLLRGDFDRGWLEYEWRWLKFPEVRRHFPKPQWHGFGKLTAGGFGKLTAGGFGKLTAGGFGKLTAGGFDKLIAGGFDITGKTILLYSEQGFGDAIQFVRFAPMVAARGATVNVECQHELARLFRQVPGVARTFSRGDSLPPFDVQCPLLSLPRALGLTVANIPNRVPYLQVDENLSRQWERRLREHEGFFKVGLVWAGTRTPRGSAERSIAVEVLAPLAKLDRMRLVSLQKDKSSRAAPPFELIDFTNDLHDFADTAALIVNLDLVIGVDTAVVHLAGALGRKVWTLLPFAAAWQWLLDRDDSPWYPTMRLFRQPRPGDWSGVIERVAESLREELGSR